MRPNSVKYFERITFAAYSLGVVPLFRDWRTIYEKTSFSPRYPVLSSTLVFVVAIALVVGMTLLVSRRGSRISMWIMLVMMLGGLPLVLTDRSVNEDPVKALITYVQMLAELAAFAFLFTPSARAWMGGRRKGASA